MRHLLYFIMITCVALFSCKHENLFASKSTGSVEALVKGDTTHYQRIKTDDKISLSIWNHDDMSVGSVFSIYNSNEAFGKWVLVDDSGDVVMPKIGRVRLGGLTCPEAADTLTKLYSELLVNPIIVVKVLNREVTVLGEVRSPGVYILDKERHTLGEVLGKAEGLEFYAKKSKVQLIRDSVNYMIDLTKIDPYYVHKITVVSGDIIYVPSKRGKSVDKKAPTLIPIASLLTSLAVFGTLISGP